MDTQNMLDLIAQRRSVRPSAMGAEEVSQEVLDAVLEAANWAPCHHLTEPWRFVVFRGEARQRLSDVFRAAHLLDYPGSDEYTCQKMAAKPLRTPVVIAVLKAAPAAVKAKATEERWAVACAVQNLSLAATAFGLSVFWSTGRPSGHPSVADFLGCTEGMETMGFLHIGTPGESGLPQGRRQAWQDKVSWADDANWNAPQWRPTPVGKEREV
jgi:nitroreductase